jgi:hypothetical protein
MFGEVSYAESVAVVLEGGDAAKDSAARMTHVDAIPDNDLTFS